jgi:hypothetical protein
MSSQVFFKLVRKSPGVSPRCVGLRGASAPLVAKISGTPPGMYSHKIPKAVDFVCLGVGNGSERKPQWQSPLEQQMKVAWLQEGRMPKEGQLVKVWGWKAVSRNLKRKLLDYPN